MEFKFLSYEKAPKNTRKGVYRPSISQFVFEMYEFRLWIERCDCGKITYVFETIQPSQVKLCT